MSVASLVVPQIELQPWFEPPEMSLIDLHALVDTAMDFLDQLCGRVFEPIHGDCSDNYSFAPRPERRVFEV